MPNAAFSIALILMLNMPHVDTSSIYGALGFDNALHTAITLSFIIYCIAFFGFCIFITAAFVRFVMRVEKLRSEDEAKAKNSLLLMRAIRSDMIELKNQKFNEERNREEAAVAAQSAQRLQSTTEEPKNLSRERRTLKGIQDVIRKFSRESERRELTSPQHEKKIASQQRQQHPEIRSLSPDLKTSKERTGSDVHPAGSRNGSAQEGEGRKASSQGSIKATLGVQATQSLDSTRSTQRSIIHSVQKKSSTVPGVIRTGASTIKPPKIKTSRKPRKLTRKAKKHKKIGKNAATAIEKTDKTIRSTIKTIAPPMQQVRVSARSASCSPLSVQKTVTAMQLPVQNTIRTIPPQLPMQNTMRTIAPQLALIQKPTHSKASLPSLPVQNATTYQALPARLSVQRTTIHSGPPQPPSLQQRAMRSAVSTQLSAQKTLIPAAPTQLSLLKTMHPTGSCRLPLEDSSCRLPVQGIEQASTMDEKEKADELSVARTQRDQYEDNSMLTFSDTSEKAIPPSSTILQTSSTIKSLGQHRERRVASKRSRLSIPHGRSSQKAVSMQSRLPSSRRGLGSQKTFSRPLSGRYGLASQKTLSRPLSGRYGLSSQKAASRRSRLLSLKRGVGSQKATSSRSHLSSVTRPLSSQKTTSRQSRLAAIKRGITSQESTSRCSGHATIIRVHNVHSQQTPTSRMSTSGTQRPTLMTAEEAPTQLEVRSVPRKQKSKDQATGGINSSLSFI